VIEKYLKTKGCLKSILRWCDFELTNRSIIMYWNWVETQINELRLWYWWKTTLTARNHAYILRLKSINSITSKKEIAFAYPFVFIYFYSGCLKNKRVDLLLSVWHWVIDSFQLFIRLNPSIFYDYLLIFQVDQF